MTCDEYRFDEYSAPGWETHVRITHMATGLTVKGVCGKPHAEKSLTRLRENLMAELRAMVRARRN